MTKKKTILFVTNCDDAKKAAAFEQQAKNVYHTKDDKPCLTFLHNTLPHKVVEKAKEKKPTAVVFEGVDSHQILQAINAIERRLNGSSPKFIQIGTKQVIEKTSVYRTHEAVKEYLID